MNQYLILSLKLSTGDLCVWYKPNAGGYTARLDRAGRYSEADAKSLTESGVTLAVLESRALTLAVSVVPYEVMEQLKT